MASLSNYLPFPVGTYLDTTGGGYLTNAVGTLYKTYDAIKGERVFRLVQNGAVALLPNSCLTSPISSGKKTWIVVGGLAAPSSSMAGIVPEEYTASIPASSYFFAQVGGNALVLAGDSLFSSLSGVESRLVAGSTGSGVARQLAAFTTASTSEEQGVFALAANTIAATAVGVTVRCLLKIALDG